jgi:pimeloyl-ACP methyl ester carboxylesterase
MNRTRLSLKISTLGFCLALVASAGRSQEVPAESKTVEIVAADGIIVYVDTYVGDPGAPTILLFHQAGSNARAEYAGLIPRLMDEGFNVLAPDQRRGGGRLGGENRTVAGLGEAEYSYCDAYADLEGVLALAEEWQLGGPRIAWGSSYSAALAIRLAAEHPLEVGAALAFSPASGDPMEGCEPESYLAGLTQPLLVLRPGSETESPRVLEQLERFSAAGHQTYIAPQGVHGSSMLNPDRAGGVEDTWEVVREFLRSVQ